jgi:hypothetical protein
VDVFRVQADPHTLSDRLIVGGLDQTEPGGHSCHEEE